MKNMKSLLHAHAVRAAEGPASFEEAYFAWGLPLWDALARQSEVTEEEVAPRLAEYCGLPLLRRAEHPVAGIPMNGAARLFFKKKAILVGRDRRGSMVVINDPFDIAALQSVLRLLSKQPDAQEDALPRIAMGLREEIAMTIEHLYPSQDDEPREERDETTMALEAEDLEQLENLAREAGIVRKVDYLINTALDARASDIHFEPQEAALLVRCRIDGILQVMDRIPRAQQAAVTSRIKLMAGLDIAERRLPQDGAISWKSLGRRVDVRVATSPTLFGESVVLRLLEKEQSVFSLTSLGLSQEQRSLIENCLFKSYGMIFVTGPTGSGKTTTLYAALSTLSDESRKIITVEDPVEYQVPGVNQVQVNPRIGLTFASALRSFLRHDPDVLLVGEVRDQETAKIAIESSLTGHLVLSTLHTKDAPTAVTRLRDLGVEPFLIADSLLLVAAQRLVRVLCPECKTVVAVSDAENRLLSDCFGQETLPEFLYVPGADGCDHCSRTGWSGREGIFELIAIDEDIRSAIASGKDAGTIVRIARSTSYKPMREHGLRKVLDGRTTMAEVMRVTSLE